MIEDQFDRCVGRISDVDQGIRDRDYPGRLCDWRGTHKTRHHVCPNGAVMTQMLEGRARPWCRMRQRFSEDYHGLAKTVAQ